MVLRELLSAVKKMAPWLYIGIRCTWHVKCERCITEFNDYYQSSVLIHFFQTPSSKISHLMPITPNISAHTFYAVFIISIIKQFYLHSIMVMIIIKSDRLNHHHNTICLCCEQYEWKKKEKENNENQVKIMIWYYKYKPLTR